MEARDRLAETMFKEEMRRLNAHLPRKRQSITELLATDTPSVSSIDGGKIIMKKTELENFAKTLPEPLLERVRLPLVLLRRTDLGPGAFALLGDPVEEFALFNVVGERKMTFDQFLKNHVTPSVFYKPQISELLRRFHSLIVIGFGVSDELYK